MREMKDSGVKWIGEIPTTWELSKIGSIYDERNEKVSDKDYEPLSVTKQGIVPQLETAAKTDNGDNRKLIKKNDFVINSRSDRRGSCGISEYDGSCSLINTVLKPRRNMCNQYYGFVFKSENFADEYYRWGHGIVNDLWSTKWSDMKNIYIPMPSIEEQKKMAEYLDSKCSQIDAIIEKQQTIIEKLKEYKLSMINEVTNVKEGISCHLGFISQMKNGLNFTDTLEGIRIKFLGVGDFKQYFFLDNEEQFSTVITESDISEDYYLKDGDIVFVRSNGSKELVGRAVMVNNISFPLTYSGFCIRFRNIRPDIIDSRFLLYYFRSPDFRKQLEKYSQGSNISNMNQDLLSRMSFTIPSMKYQIDALEHLEIKCKKIDEKVDNTELFINKLLEYKKSLIYEVVTGKKEV